MSKGQRKYNGTWVTHLHRPDGAPASRRHRRIELSAAGCHHACWRPSWVFRVTVNPTISDLDTEPVTPELTLTWPRSGWTAPWMRCTLPTPGDDVPHTALEALKTNAVVSDPVSRYALCAMTRIWGVLGCHHGQPALKDISDHFAQGLLRTCPARCPGTTPKLDKHVPEFDYLKLNASWPATKAEIAAIWTPSPRHRWQIIYRRDTEPQNHANNGRFGQR